jgi:hypothetical protein
MGRRNIMSREFGSHLRGYFHHQIEYAAQDCLDGRDETTRKWGKFLRALEPVAYAIATSEACDSGEEFPVMETIKHMPALEAALDEIKRHIKVYENIADQAVRDAMEKGNK